MKLSCIREPENTKLIVIKQWQVDYCYGNKCAAALLSFFIYWHDIKMEMSNKNKMANDIAERHGDIGAQDTSTLQFHNTQELEDGILNIYKKSTIKTGLDLLVELGAISIEKNPNDRYKFDNTKYFQLYPETVNEALNNRPAKNSVSSAKNSRRSTKNNRRSTENNRIRTKTTPKTTTETTDKKTLSVSNETSRSETPKNGLDSFDKIPKGKTPRKKKLEPSNQHNQLAKKLFKIIDTKKTSYTIPKNQDPSTWHLGMRDLEEMGYDLPFVNKVLNWYSLHLNDPYVPQCFSGNTFRDKFDKLLAAIDRSEQNKNRNRPNQNTQQTANWDSGNRPTFTPEGAGLI